MSKPLEGVKIIDFTHVQAGPACTQLLAWFGADVIKVERPGSGDVTRNQLRDIPEADALYFTMLNSNKRSLTLDTKTQAGKEVLEKLIKESDVLVENFAPGALDRMGFTWEKIQEYNSRMIHLLSIHEGTPGHYLEGWHSAKFPSTLRAVLRSGLFAEGWAVYTEPMMREQGYLNNDPLFHLVQLKFYLRTISNAILDQGVHVDNWDREKAMHLMTHDAFQQESEAAGKWVRAQLTSAQLPTYFVGAQEHFDTRKAVQEKLGDKFNLKAYHDQMLSYGAPPVRFARQLMLDQPIE